MPDLPGFGLSGKPAVVADVGAHAATVAALMDVSGIGHAAMLGNSFGGQVAVEPGSAAA